MIELVSQGNQTRTDVIWQRSSGMDAYHASRTGIPFADAHFDVMVRLLEAAGYADVDCAFKAFELAVFAGRRPSS